MVHTKQKILDTAERLIGEQGYAATSLRQIIADAGVNLAAVHYHFGSKEDLLDELIARKVGPVNERRREMLERFEMEAGSAPPPVEKILAAFFEPMVEEGGRSPEFVRVMGRMYVEGLLPGIASKHLQPTILRFTEALRRSLPGLPPGELLWRLQFMIGAMSHAVCSAPRFAKLLDMADGPPDFRRTMRRLIVFMTAGFQAPPMQEE